MTVKVNTKIAPNVSRKAEDFQPLNDMVLVKPIAKPLSDVVDLVESDYWKQDSNWAEVIAVGEGRIVNGILFPIDLDPGDIVRITQFGEEIELEKGVKHQLIHAAEIKGRWKK